MSNSVNLSELGLIGVASIS